MGNGFTAKLALRTRRVVPHRAAFDENAVARHQHIAKCRVGLSAVTNSQVRVSRVDHVKEPCNLWSWRTKRERTGVIDTRALPKDRRRDGGDRPDIRRQSLLMTALIGTMIGGLWVSATLSGARGQGMRSCAGALASAELLNMDQLVKEIGVRYQQRFDAAVGGRCGRAEIVSFLRTQSKFIPTASRGYKTSSIDSFRYDPRISLSIYFRSRLSVSIVSEPDGTFRSSVWEVEGL